VVAVVAEVAVTAEDAVPHTPPEAIIQLENVLTPAIVWFPQVIT
jgi:hypothetical protein